MADKAKKTEGNIIGKYYVDSECIACGICIDEASDFFRMSQDGSHAEVYLQPTDPVGTKACEAAKSSCPADAIGNDG